MTFTHTPDSENPSDYEALKYNINPLEVDKKSYVKKQYEVNRKDAFEEPKVKYRVHDEDKDLIKKYKK